MMGLSNLVLSSILMRMGSWSGATPAYPHHSIRSNSCTIRATVYSICKWPNTRPKQMRGPMLKGTYCDDVGVHVSHLHGSHVSTSAKPMTASRRCELITAYAAQAGQCHFSQVLTVRDSLAVLTYLLALEHSNRLLTICSTTRRQARICFGLANVEPHYACQPLRITAAPKAPSVHCSYMDDEAARFL
jgi:hypothetical protein